MRKAFCNEVPLTPSQKPFTVFVVEKLTCSSGWDECHASRGPHWRVSLGRTDPPICIFFRISVAPLKLFTTQLQHIFLFFQLYHTNLCRIAAGAGRHGATGFRGQVSSATSPCERRIQGLSDAVWCCNGSNQHSR